MRGELRHGSVRRVHAVIGIAEHAVGHLGAEFLPQLELAQEGYLSEYESVEVVVPNQGRPTVGSEFKVLHAREGTLVQNVGGIAREHVQQRPRHLAYDGSGIEMNVGHAERRNPEFPVHIQLRLEVAYVSFPEPRDGPRQVYGPDRIVGVYVGLVEISAVHGLFFREAGLEAQFVGSHAGKRVSRIPCVHGYENIRVIASERHFGHGIEVH